MRANWHWDHESGLVLPKDCRDLRRPMFTCGPAFYSRSPGDPNYANVVFEYPFVDANGATTFTDKGPLALTATNFGSPIIDNTQQVFPSVSSEKPGTGGFYVNNAACNLSGKTWTLDFWWYPTSFPLSFNRAVFLSLATFNTDVPGRFLVYSDSTGKFKVNTNPSTTLSGTKQLTANAWNYCYVACTDGSVTFTLGVNGSTESVVQSGGFAVGSNTVAVIGDGPGSFPPTGYFAQIRLTSGVIRSAAVPTAPFPTHA